MVALSQRSTLNSGRMLITLKSIEERTLTATEVIAELRQKLAAVPGITLYLQPVQDLTIEDRVSRTQFQFILEDPNAERLSEWVPRLIDRLKQSPHLADVASDLQDRGLRALFAGDTSPGHKLTVERVYDLIEAVVDRCEDVMDVVDGIVVEQV